ncbi:MAG: hypothetical protein ACRCZ9_01965 [Fusobacteriaceae bacterium]
MNPTIEIIAAKDLQAGWTIEYRGESHRVLKSKHFATYEVEDGCVHIPDGGIVILLCANDVSLQFKGTDELAVYI